MGDVYQPLGDLPQVKQYIYEHALDINIKHLGFNHVNVSIYYLSLGTVHRVLGGLQQAKQYYEGALDIRIKQDL